MGITKFRLHQTYHTNRRNVAFDWNFTGDRIWIVKEAGHYSNTLTSVREIENQLKLQKSTRKHHPSLSFVNDRTRLLKSLKTFQSCLVEHLDSFIFGRQPVASKSVHNGRSAFQLHATESEDVWGCVRAETFRRIVSTCADSCYLVARLHVYHQCPLSLSTSSSSIFFVHLSRYLVRLKFSCLKMQKNCATLLHKLSCPLPVVMVMMAITEWWYWWWWRW